MTSLTPRIDKIDTNYIINGNFDNWQRGTSHTSNGFGSVDRHFIATSFGGVVTMSRNTDVPNANSLYSMDFAITTPSAISSTQYIATNYKFEGSLTRAINGKNLSLGFWFKSSHTGKHSGFIFRGDNVRRYIFEFNYDVADTWQYIKVDFNLDLLSFVLDVNTNFIFGFNMAVGSTYQRAAGTWANSNEFGVTGGLDLSNISGAYIRLSQLQLVENTGQLLDGSSFSYAGGDVTKDLDLCKRYYEVVPLLSSFTYANSTATQYWESRPWKVTKRTSPSISTVNFTMYSGGGSSGVFVPNVLSADTVSFSVGTSGQSTNLNGILGGSIIGDAEL